MSDDDSKLVEFFRKIGGGVLNPGKIADYFRNSFSNIGNISEKSEGKVPSFLKGFFERRDAGWDEYVMLKAQLSLVFLYIFAIFFALTPFHGLNLAVGFLLIILGGYTIYLTKSEIKGAFKKDFSAYRDFVYMLLGLVIFLIMLVRFFPYQILQSEIVFILPTIIVLIAALGIYTVFRVKHGRNHTFGTVEKLKGGKAVVKTNYDIRSNTKQGTYLLKTMEDVEPGDEVKVKVERNVLGLRGSQPTKVIGKK